MTTASTDRILIRMREVIEGATVTLRGISANTYGTNLPDGLDVNEEARRTMIGSDGVRVMMEASIPRMERSPASPPVIGNLALYDIYPEVRVVVLYSAPATLTGALRDSLRGLVVSAGDVLAQAFGFPGNLTTTTGGEATGLVSGLLAFVGGSAQARAVTNQPGGVYEAVYKFKGVLRVAPAIV